MKQRYWLSFCDASRPEGQCVAELYELAMLAKYADKPLPLTASERLAIECVEWLDSEGP